MAIDAQIVTLTMTDVINVRVRSAHSVRMVPTYGAWVAYAARVERNTSVMRSSSGEPIQPSWRVLTELEIPVDAQVMLPPDAQADPIAVPPDATKALTPVNSSYAYGLGILDHWETAF